MNIEKSSCYCIPYYCVIV